MTRLLQAAPGLSPLWPEPDGHLFSDRRWLHVMEGRLPGEPVSLALVEGGVPRVWMYGSVPAAADCDAPFNLPELLLGDPPVFPLAGAILERRAALAASGPPPGRWFPNLVLSYPGYDARPAGPGAGDPEAVERFVGLAVDWARGRRLAAIGVLYCPDEQVGLREALVRHGFHGAAVTARSELALAGDGLDGYLRTLRSHRRVEVRRELAWLRQAGVAVGRLELAPWAERVVDLRMNLVRNYGGYSDRATEAIRLERLRAAFGDERLVLIGARCGDQLLGFSLFLAAGERWYTHWVGREYGHSKARHVYFACTFSAAVEEASRHGVRVLDVGVGHEATKAARGCRLRPLAIWVRPLLPELEPVASAALGLMRS